MTKKKRPSGLAAELNETAEGMHRIGLLDRAAHDKITLRHLGRNGASKVATITLAQAMRASARMRHAGAYPIQCATLTTAQIQNWLRDLANSPARLRTKASAKKPNVRSLDKNDPEAVRRRRASANRTLVILKAALNSAWRAGKIHSDQAWQRVAPFEEADAARVRYLAIAEAKRLVDSSAPDFRQLVQAALVTGARYGELASLRASDLPSVSMPNLEPEARIASTM